MFRHSRANDGTDAVGSRNVVSRQMLSDHRAVVNARLVKLQQQIDASDDGQNDR